MNTEAPLNQPDFRDVSEDLFNENLRKYIGDIVFPEDLEFCVEVSIKELCGEFGVAPEDLFDHSRPEQS